MPMESTYFCFNLQNWTAKKKNKSVIKYETTIDTIFIKIKNQLDENINIFILINVV